MSIFIKINNRERNRLFHLVKENVNSSWDNFYPQLGISRAMFFNYLSGKYNIPENVFLNLKKIAQINVIKYKKIDGNRYTQKIVLQPKIDSYLAEILGVLNGDGYVSDIKYEISVVLNEREKDYALYLKDLFEKKFKISFNLIMQPGKIRLKTYSIALFKILTSKYGLPNGKKKGNLSIPRKVFDNSSWLIAYVRGLFDTDGTFYIRRKKDPVIEISSADKKYLFEIKSLLQTLDFSVSLLKNHLAIYKIDEIKKFFEEIKPANSKHLKKYQSYLNSSGAGSSGAEPLPSKYWI